MQQQPHIPYVDSSAVPADAFILDVREPDEWAAGHVDGSLHIPMGQIPERFAEVPNDQRVTVVCRSGGRSARVTAFLREQGYDAVNLEGGLTDWARSGKAVSGQII